MKVELVDHHGSDLLVCNAARVSFAKDTDWEYVEQDSKLSFDMTGAPFKETVPVLSARDAKLINYLARERHVLPFRHPQITLRCKAPIFLARQLGKHQVGLSWSEESRRYIDNEPEFFWPDKWRKRAENVKQGSSADEVTHMKFANNVESWDGEVGNFYQLHVEQSIQLYESMLKADVAPEMARMVLPQSMEVNWVWTGSLLSFFEMYKLRSEGHAQKEAQDFAELVKEIVCSLYPVSWQALENNI